MVIFKKLIVFLENENGIILRGGCAVAAMVVEFIGMIIALIVGEYEVAGGLALLLGISVIMSVISTAISRRRARREYESLFRNIEKKYYSEINDKKETIKLEENEKIDNSNKEIKQ